MYLITVSACENFDTIVTSKSYNTYIKIRKTPNFKYKYCMKYKSFNIMH